MAFLHPISQKPIFTEIIIEDFNYESHAFLVHKDVHKLSALVSLINGEVFTKIDIGKLGPRVLGLLAEYVADKNCILTIFDHRQITFAKDEQVVACSKIITAELKALAEVMLLAKEWEHKYLAEAALVGIRKCMDPGQIKQSDFEKLIPAEVLQEVIRIIVMEGRW